MAGEGIALRVDIEQREREQLSPHAALSAESRGRTRPKPLDEFRTEFQRDRERILHCKAFRRLSHKTQVFLSPEGDHYRTRLTHTLEVSQIARSIARTLRLNEDLTEAIALGHDLGHTPFGHTGEQALSDALAHLAATEPGRFPGAPTSYEHVMQSLRIVDHLEYDGKGLNLTWETRDGIAGHSGAHFPETLEGQIVRTADRIAYINHDIDDAFRAGVLTEEQLPEAQCAVLGHSSIERITTLVNDMVSASVGRDRISMTPEIERAMLDLRSFLFSHVYESADAHAEKPRAGAMVQQLFFYYLDHLDEVPAEYRGEIETNPVQMVVDFVSGMTDRYAIRQFESIFIPKVWRL